MYSVSPEILAFGDGLVGESKSVLVTLNAPPGEKVCVKVNSLPDEISFEKEGDRYRVTLSPTRPGAWDIKIELVFIGDVNNVTQEIKCVANVLEKSTSFITE